MTFLLLWYPQDADGCPIDIKVIPNGDGTFRCSYVPTKPIKHTIIVSWGGVNVPKSPFRVCPPMLPLAHYHQESQGIRAQCSRFWLSWMLCEFPFLKGPTKRLRLVQLKLGLGSYWEGLALSHAYSLSIKLLPTGECGRRQPS